MIAIASLLLIVTLSLLVTRVATVVLTATGMARHVARFQARSAFTGAGFTTSESERVVNHPVRRKVVGWLMLLGNVGIVGAASTTILGFRGGALGATGWRILLLVLGLLALVLLSRSRWVDRRLTAAVGRLLRRHTDLDGRDLDGLLKLSGDFSVQELGVNPGDWLAERNLADLDLRDEGVVVLGVVRSSGGYLGAPNGRTTIHAGDNLVLYGRTGRLRELDRRARSADGDRAHDLAVQEHARAAGDEVGEEVGAEASREAGHPGTVSGADRG